MEARFAEPVDPDVEIRLSREEAEFLRDMLGGSSTSCVERLASRAEPEGFSYELYEILRALLGSRADRGY